MLSIVRTSPRRRISFFNDDVQALLFDPKELAPTYPESIITRPFPFNAFYDIDDVPEVDASTYRSSLRVAPGDAYDGEAVEKAVERLAIAVGKSGQPVL